MIKFLYVTSLILVAHGFIGIRYITPSVLDDNFDYIHLIINLLTLCSGCAILLALILTTDERN